MRHLLAASLLPIALGVIANTPSASGQTRPARESSTTEDRADPVVGYAKFGYRERTATGSSSTQLAQVSVFLPETMEVHVRADTSATCLNEGQTTFATGFSVDQLPANVKDPPWSEAARFTTIRKARQWVPCTSTYVAELDRGEHTIYWFAGDVNGGPVIFDAGVMSLQGFPLRYRSPGRGSKKLALLVGINDYQRVSNLRGCENDVTDMKDLLINRFGFAEDDFRVLLNEEATYNNILTVFRDHLVDKASPGTIAVFYYSGHGSLQRDELGGDEQDGYDETIVAHDSRTLQTPDDISDDKIRRLFTDLSQKTPYVTFIFDSCHSGTITKDRGALARRVEPNEEIPAKDPNALPASGILSDRSRNYVLVSGCTADELSFEYRVRGRHRGALTYFLTRAVRDSVDPGLTYRKMMEAVSARVTSVYPSQHPQIEGGNADLPVFRIRAKPAERFVLASPEGTSIVVASGEVRGMTVGSQFNVFTPLASDLSDPAQRLARIELTSVGPFSSRARRVSGRSFPSSSRAVEAEHAYPASRFPVFFDTTGISREEAVRSPLAVKNVLDTLSGEERFTTYFQEVDNWGDAQLIFCETSGGNIEISDGVYPLESNVSDASPELILDKLQHWAKWLRIVRFEHPGASPLPVDFELVVPERSEPLPASPWKSEHSYLEGERIVCSVTNNSEVDVFVTVLACGSKGTVEVLYPRPQGDGTISHSPLKNKGDEQQRDTREIEVGKASLGDTPRRTRDVIKFIATDQPIDVQSLSLRAAPRGSSFAAALFGDMFFSSKQTSRASMEVTAWISRTVVIDVVKQPTGSGT